MSKLNVGKASVLALTATFAVVAMLLGKSLTAPAFATQSTSTPTLDSCNQETTYTKSSDFNDSRVHIDFQNFDGDNDSRVVITPASGYKLVSIGVDYTGSDANEANPSVGDGLSAVTYTAPFKDDDEDDERESIDHVTVTFKKICSEVCNDDSATNYSPVVEGQSVANNELCEYQSETPAPESTPAPEATPLSCSGDTHPDAAGKNCVSFQYGGPSNSGGTGGQVLGASTMAKTGSFDESLYLAIMTLGGIFTSKGIRNFKKAFKKA